MGQILVVVLILLGVGGGYSYEHPEFLQNNAPWLAEKLGLAKTPVVGEDPNQLRQSSAPRTLTKCVGDDGQVVYSNIGCDHGEREQKVHLSRTTVISLNDHPTANLKPSSANAGAASEAPKQTMDQHLHDKFAPH